MSLFVTVAPTIETDAPAKKAKTSKHATEQQLDWMSWQRHELGAVFHDMTESEFASLRRDIETGGQLHPIILFEGKVLDGWHRLRACRELGRVPLFDDLPANVDPLHHSLGSNAERRQSKPSQLTISLVILWLAQDTSQMDIVAGRSASPLAQVLARIGSNIKLTKATLARFARVSERLVQQARRVVVDGAPEVVEAVKEGTLSLERAVQLVKTPIEDQPAELEAYRVAAANNQTQKIEKHKARAAQKRELGTLVEFAYGANTHDTFSEDAARKRAKYVVAVLGRVENCVIEVNDLAVVMADIEPHLFTTEVLKTVIESCEKLRSAAVKINKRIVPLESAI